MAKTKKLTGFVGNFSDMLPILEVMLNGDSQVWVTLDVFQNGVVQLIEKWLKGSRRFIDG